MTELALAFMAGLAGSGHCLGMCGGLVSALAVTTNETSHLRRFFSTLSYHLGRISTYTILGIVVGAASQGAMITNYTFAFRLLFIAANLLVVIIGISTMLGIQSMSLSRLDGTPWSGMGRFLASVSKSKSPFPYAAAGLLMGLLPCGLLYGVLLSVAGAGSWMSGGAKMLAFGLGTVPALLFYGQIASTLRSVGGNIFLRIMGGVVAIMGVVGICKILIRMGILKMFMHQCC